MNSYWVWLIGGLLPYYIKLQKSMNEKTFEVRALFWSFTLCLRDRRDYKWTVQCPLIKMTRK